MKSVSELYKSKKQFERCKDELEYIFTMHVLISNLLRLFKNRKENNYDIFIKLRHCLIEQFPFFNKNKYLKNEIWFVKIAIWFVYHMPWIFKVILK
jgi:hypothetical protein